MGSWQLEVVRMTVYILFPIGIYYYVNQTENIEEWIANERKKYDVSDNKRYIEFKQFVEELNNKQQMKHLTELEAEYCERKMI